MKTNSKKIKRYALTTLTVTMVLVVLFFGLRPKTWPITNDIQWLPDKKALQFHHHGIAYVDDLDTFRNKHHLEEFTLIMGVAAEGFRNRGFRPILMMHDGADRHQLTIWHWGASVIVMNGDDYDYTRKWPRVSALDTLTPGEASLITVTSSDMGTRLFINGTLVNESKNWRLTVPVEGEKLRLVIGNSVYGKHGWRGEFYGLAAYNRAFSPEEVGRHYDIWRGEKHFPNDAKDGLLLLYTFDEWKGRLIQDQSGSNQSLQVPFLSVMLKKAFLSSPWHNFKPDRTFFVDVVLNIIGFFLLGVVLYGWLRQSYSIPGRYMRPTIVAFCFLLSLSMEILQAWLPARTSSLLDLTLNTAGAWVGIVLLDRIYDGTRDHLQKRFPGG